MNVKLVVVQGKPEGKEIPVRTAKFLIGRGTECHLRPNSELISRHHCLILVGEHGVALRDLGSTNGTRVNGERLVGEVALCHEDMIQVGPLGFRLELERVPAAVPDAAALPRAKPRVLNVAALGARDAPESEIERFLAADAAAGSGQDSGLLDVRGPIGSDTAIGQAEGQDTKPEFAPPVDVPAAEPAADAVTLASGLKKKLGNARSKIDKTREDTSRAAADILRRMVDRRSGS